MVSKSMMEMFRKPVKASVFINSHPMPPAPTIKMFFDKVSESVDDNKSCSGARGALGVPLLLLLVVVVMVLDAILVVVVVVSQSKS